MIDYDQNSDYNSSKKKKSKNKYDSSRDVDRETYLYFQRVMQTLENEPFEDEEQKAIFVENVFSQTSGDEMHMACNQLVSRVIEQLLPLSGQGARKKFMVALSDDLRTVATDPFASHVLQTLVTISTFTKSPQSEDDEDSVEDFDEFVTKWVLKVCKFMTNNLEEFSTDLCASHLLRTSFQCASGNKLEENPKKGHNQNFQNRNQNFQNQKKVESNKSVLHNSKTKDDFSGVLSLAVEKVLEIEDIKEKCRFETFSGVMQSLLAVTWKSNSADAKRICKHLFKKMSESFDEISPPSDFEQVKVSTIFREDAPCRLLETILEVTSDCAPKLFEKISKKLFEQKLVTLSQLPLANFSVQKLLGFCKNKEKFESWYENEFDANLEKIFDSKNYGVLLALTQACKRLGAKQAHFLTAVMRSLGCYEPSQNQIHIVPLLIQMMAKDNYNIQEQNFNVNLHGSLILQELFSFNKPIKLVTSLLALDGVKLRNLFSDPKGSHLVDVFVKSPSIGEKSRDALVKNLQGQFVSLACSKCGSRALDALWSHGSLRARESIASELVPKEAHLNSNPFGKFISRKAALSVFKRSRDQWKTAIGQQDHKRTLAEDFAADFGPKKQFSPKNQIQTSVPAKKLKIEDDPVEPDFVIDTHGNDQLLTKNETSYSQEEKKKKKDKKKKAKSYLDDL